MLLPPDNHSLWRVMSERPVPYRHLFEPISVPESGGRAP